MHEWGDTELFYYYMKRNEQKKLATRQYYVAIVQREKKFIKSKIKCMKERERDRGQSGQFLIFKRGMKTFLIIF